MTALRISQASELTGLPSSTLRYWEQIGLISSARTPAGYRVFDDRAIERLRFINAAKRLDLPLDTVRELLSTWDNDTCRSVKQRLRPMVEQRLTQAQEGIEELVELSATLRAGLARLDELPDRDTPCDPGCSFLDPSPRSNEEADDAVIACSLEGADHDIRLERWHSALASADITRAELSATAVFEGDVDEELVTLIQDEQRCCPFLGFRLEFEHGTTRLTVSAPNALAESFVDALLPGPATA